MKTTVMTEFRMNYIDFIDNLNANDFASEWCGPASLVICNINSF